MGERDVPVPKYHELLWPTLRALEELGGSGKIDEIVDKIIELEGLTEEQQSVLQGEGPTTLLWNRAGWARSHLKKVGAVDNSQRGVWALTEKGRNLTEGGVADIPRQVREITREERNARKTAEPDSHADDAEEFGDAWREKALEAMLAMPADAFERLAQQLLREAGFVSVTVTRVSGDGGLDGTGVYRLALVGFPVFFQCKRYRGTVGPGAVRDFRGAMSGRGDKGLLITTGTFSADAKVESAREGAPPIDLIDGYQLCDLLKDYRLGITVTERVVEDIEVDESFFRSLGTST
jgi:restriction system protein